MSADQTATTTDTETRRETESETERDTDRSKEDRIAELENLADLLITRLRQQEERGDRLEARMAEFEARLDEQGERVDDVADRTDLLQHVRRASALKPAERAAVCIQTLATEAGVDGRATMDANGAVKALGGDADRTNMYGPYGVFAKAVDLVGDEDVLWVEQESRASAKNTRLVLDRSAGELPSTVAGHEVSAE